MFEFFDHPSDIGVRGIGKSYEEAFCEAARGMMTIMADLNFFKNDFSLTFETDGIDREFLFLNFLNKILFESYISKVVWTDVTILKFSDNYIKAELKGEKLSSTHKGGLKTEVKAATLYELKVYKKDKDFIAQCILDV